MNKIILVSNRLPVTVTKSRSEGIKYEDSVGGLATGLKSYKSDKESIWIGWPGLPENRASAEQKEKVKTTLKDKGCYPVWLSQNDIVQYYEGFSNKTIWPLFHYFTNYVKYDDYLWKSYKQVNEKFAKAILSQAKDGDTIWIHDYHLMLLPRMIRKKMPNVKIGFFLHIPFPSFEIFRLLPWRQKLLKGLLGADIIGFHTTDYAQHFLKCARHLTHKRVYGAIVRNGHKTDVRVYPMGIDFEKFYQSGDLPQVQKEVGALRKNFGDRKVILSMDRLDYSKGILKRLEAYEYFLEKNPSLREKVTLVLVVVPSRTKVSTYHALKKQIDEMVGRINGKYGDFDSDPIVYQYRSFSFPTLSALYNVADIALITPLRDGMNLVAKEYLAAKKGKGVLILSEMAGAAEELKDTLLVNPNNKKEIAKAIRKAITIPAEVQEAHNSNMLESIRENNVGAWATRIIDDLESVVPEQKEAGPEEKVKKKRLSRLIKTQTSDLFS